MYWQIYKIRHIFLQYTLHIIKSFSFYKSTVYKKSAMSLNVKPDDRRMSAQKNASVFGLGFPIRGRGPTVIYCVFLFNSDSPKFRGTKAATQKLWVLRVPTQKNPLKPVMAGGCGHYWAMPVFLDLKFPPYPRPSQ